MKHTAYLGIPGSNSYTAAKQYFGEGVELLGCSSFHDLFTKVRDGNAHYAMIPIENTLAGTVVENFDLLNRFDLPVVGEFQLKFENHLLGISSDKKPDGQLKRITEVYSHPQPLLQCSRFFEEHPWMEKKTFSDTARAAEYVSKQNNPSYAVIANRDAAELYGLDILQENIADNAEHNFTRFFVIANEHRHTNDTDKCSLLFTLLHEPGSLVKVLQIISDHDLNLTKIESRPIHGKPYEYIFSVDFTWHDKKRADVELTIQKIRSATQSLKVLGMYKAAPLPF